jgi:putative transposase
LTVAWLAKCSGKYSKLTSWVEQNVEEAMTYFRLPLAHRKNNCQTSLNAPPYSDKHSVMCG